MNFHRNIMILLGLALISCTPVRLAQTQAPLAADIQEAEIQVERVVLDGVSSQSPGSGAGDIQLIGGDEDSLREFIRRWFGRIYPGAPEGDTIIQVGSLPDKLPVELPLPDGAQVIASVQDPYDFLQVILDVNLAPEEISEFYALSLAAAGWQPAPEWPHGGGFVPSGGTAGEQYCLGESDGFLEIRTQLLLDGLTDVRLSLHAPADFHQCQVSGPEYMDPGMQQIPALEAPQGVQMTGGGAGSSEDSAYASTDFKTSLPAEALLAHFNAQLGSAGWQLIKEGSTEVVSWSAWQLTDDKGDEWGGTLLVMDTLHTPDHRFALLMVEKSE